MGRTLMDNDEMHLTVDFSTGHPVVGLVLRIPLTHNFLKYLREMQEDLLITLGVLGFETVLTAVTEGEESVIRLNKLLGYEEELTADGLTWLAQDIM